MNSSPAHFVESQIIYEDSDMVLINKVATQIVQPDKKNTSSLVDEVKNYLTGKHGNRFGGVIHRLDRPVSGMVIFAKNRDALIHLNQQFQNHQIQKVYWAIVQNRPPKRKDTLVHFMIKNEAQNKSYIVEEAKSGVLKAELNYQILAQSDRYYLLEIRPKTGRHHQIRLQLATIGCPIKGDLKYGFKRSNKDSSISLHARELTFFHPTKKEMLTFTAKAPQEPLWQYFEKTVLENK